MNNIQRYLTKYRTKAAYFGEREELMTADFTWFFGKGNEKIGIGEIGDSGIGAFAGGFMDAGDEFVVDRTGSYLEIYRNNFVRPHSGGLVGRSEDILRGMNTLIEMLNKGIVHSFLSSGAEHGCNQDILTFSMGPPPEDLYRKGNRMIVKELK